MEYSVILLNKEYRKLSLPLRGESHSCFCCNMGFLIRPTHYFTTTPNGGTRGTVTAVPPDALLRSVERLEAIFTPDALQHRRADHCLKLLRDDHFLKPPP